MSTKDTKKSTSSRKSGKPKRCALSFNSRIFQITVVFGLCMAMSIGAVGYTMFQKKHLWTGSSALNPLIRNSVVTRTIKGSRGMITDRNGTPIASTSPAYTIAANFDTRTEEQKAQDDAVIAAQRKTVQDQALLDNRSEQVEAALEAADAKIVGSYVEDPKAFAKALKTVLGDVIDENAIVKMLENGQKQGKSQIELGVGTKRITTEDKEKLESMQIPGMTFIEDIRRDYPVTPYSSNMIGFADYDESTENIAGKLGLEQSLDSYLSAKNGIIQYNATNVDQVLPGSEVVLQETEDGDNVKLTLDSTLQETVESVLAQTMDTGKAEQAWAIVMNPKTGEILAWGSYPTFDQNIHLTIPSPIDNISTRVVEPGSVVKPLVYAAAIDSGVYPSDDTVYRAGEFCYTVDPMTGKIRRLENGSETDYPIIYDALQTDYGTLTFADGLAHSSNIAICELLTNYLDQQTFEKYLKAFGLYEKVDTPFILESVGKGNYTQATDYLSTGFGQASSLTMLELCQAYTAVFNDGKMMKPYVVDSITDSETGEVIQQFKPEVTGHPISAETAQKVRQLMVGVGAEGMTGERFTIDGIDIALKTGTGEIYDTNIHGYSRVNYTSTVMGAAPADDPQVMVLWGMQGPNYLGYSGDYFKNIMNAAIKSVGINMSDGSDATEPEDTWSAYEMPSLVNHSVSWAQEKMSGKDVTSVVLGNGDTVTSQYPLAGSSINTNDTILLLTNGSEITMPDMTGWTRKDLTAFWQLTGLAVQMSGYGTVSYQSIPAGEVIPPGTTIEVTLWQQENSLAQDPNHTTSSDEADTQSEDTSPDVVRQTTG